ncbi:hypothetical protein HY345_01105 [Candidatus Microgenomates bacterium]|nr:hypothetical protein [Candidatus Microgenomates bacterium]
MLTRLELSTVAENPKGSARIELARKGRETTLILPVGQEGETVNVNYFIKPNSTFEETKIDIHTPGRGFLVRATPEIASVVEPYGLYGYLVTARNIARNSENPTIRQRFLDVSSLIHTAIIEPNLGFQPTGTWIPEYRDDITTERLCLRLEHGLIVADIPVREGKGHVNIYSFNQRENGLPVARLGARADEFGDLNNRLSLNFDLDREGNIIIDKESAQFIDTFYNIQPAGRQFQAQDGGSVIKVNLENGKAVSLTEALNNDGGGIQLMHHLAEESLRGADVPNAVPDKRMSKVNKSAKKLMLELEFALRKPIPENY